MIRGKKWMRHPKRVHAFFGASRAPPQGKPGHSRVKRGLCFKRNETKRICGLRSYGCSPDTSSVTPVCEGGLPQTKRNETPVCEGGLPQTKRNEKAKNNSKTARSGSSLAPAWNLHKNEICVFFPFLLFTSIFLHYRKQEAPQHWLHPPNPTEIRST